MPGKRSRWILAGVWLALMVALCALLARSLIASSQRATCAGNLQVIAQALSTYGSEPGANAQDTIQALVDAGRLSPQRVRCPGSGGPYHFILPIASPPTKAEPTAVVAYEPLSNHGGSGAWVLYADGHVIFEAPERFEELLEQSTKTHGQRPAEP